MTDDWLDAVPIRRLKYEHSSGERISILVPKFRRWPLSRYLQPRLKRPHIKVKLDEVGSFIWELCDGARCVREIIEEVKLRFGARAEPAEKRIKAFLIMLYRDKFISFGYHTRDEYILK